MALTVLEFTVKVVEGRYWGSINIIGIHGVPNFCWIPIHGYWPYVLQALGIDSYQYKLLLAAILFYYCILLYHCNSILRY